MLYVLEPFVVFIVEQLQQAIVKALFFPYNLISGFPLSKVQRLLFLDQRLPFYNLISGNVQHLHLVRMIDYTNLNTEL